MLSLCLHFQKGQLMAKPLTQSQIIDKLATANNLPKSQMKAILGSISAMAYKEAKNGFVIPGLGKLVIVARKARMGRNPATGESIKIPAKKALKFKISKTCKDAVAPPKAASRKKAAKR